jgi:hypothetical protein
MSGRLHRIVIALALVVSIYVTVTSMPVFAAGTSQQGEIPLRTVLITLPKGTQSQFFEQLKKFASKHAFAIRIARTRPDVPHYLIQMWREDIKIVGANPFHGVGFSVSFFQNDDHQIDAKRLDRMVADLKKTLGSVHGVTIVDKPTRTEKGAGRNGRGKGNGGN